MRIIKTEKIIISEVEFQILDKTRILLDDIYAAAENNGDIENASDCALNYICDLLDNYVIIEG